MLWKNVWRWITRATRREAAHAREQAEIEKEVIQDRRVRKLERSLDLLEEQVQRAKALRLDKGRQPT
jgi:hypothetical protein